MKLLATFTLICGLSAVAPVVTAQSAPATGDRFKLPATDDGLPGAGPLRRADWFQKVWAERRSRWAQRVEQDQHAVVFLGDSITQGWNDDFRGLFRGVKTANRGISGDTTRGVLIRLEDDVLALNPAAIVLLIGTNDLADKADPETIASNLKLILARLKAHNPGMPVILCQVFPSSEKKDRPAEKIKTLNQLYAAAVKGDAQITLVETWTLFANAQGDARPEEFPDLLHLNDTAYSKWAAALRPLLATHGFIENEPDTFAAEDGFVSLFNGRNLSGWGYRTNHFEGQTTSTDGRYVARNGRIIVTTPPEGRKVQQMWTTREFARDFILKLEFRATPNADSGVFIRKPQLQCRDYPLAGPYKSLTRYKPQDWNELTAIVTNGVAFCTCNGEVLEAAFKVPETGPIGLEGDRGQMEYRRIRVKELP
jgi:lysophospholipase L1-like esterase